MTYHVLLLLLFSNIPFLSGQINISTHMQVKFSSQDSLPPPCGANGVGGGF